MRKINTIIALFICILIADHLIFGSLHLLGLNAHVTKPLALTMFVLVLVHVVISMIVTVRAEKAGMKTKARYNKENKDFWMRRTSGMGILVFALLHVFLMGKGANGVPKIATAPAPLKLATPLLVVSIFAHLFSNVKPLLISLGVKNPDKKEKIVKVLIIILCLFALSANICRTFFFRGGSHD